jgi:pimeloyl-ACP methyl ester carboxylesterase
MFMPRRVPAKFLREYSVGLATRPSQLKSTADDTVTMPEAARGLSRDYGKISVPVHIIAGAQDQVVTTDEQSGRLHAALPSSSIDVLEGVGHMTHHARPDLVVAAVDRLTRQSEESSRQRGWR